MPESVRMDSEAGLCCSDFKSSRAYKTESAAIDGGKQTPKQNERGNMKNSKPIIIKRVPESLTVKQARTFLEEVRPLLEYDCPQLVFDLSNVRRIDCAGVDLLLHCLKEAARRDGDLKLAAPSPQCHVVLNLTRASRLFEIFASSVDAVHSFSTYLPNVVRQIRSESEVDQASPKSEAA